MSKYIASKEAIKAAMNSFQSDSWHPSDAARNCGITGYYFTPEYFERTLGVAIEAAMNSCQSNSWHPSETSISHCYSQVWGGTGGVIKDNTPTLYEYLEAQGMDNELLRKEGINGLMRKVSDYFVLYGGNYGR